MCEDSVVLFHLRLELLLINNGGLMQDGYSIITPPKQDANRR